MKKAIILLLWLSFFSLNSFSGVIQQISISGNKITKDYIIQRELTFHVGDTIDSSEISQLVHDAEMNLINTSLFNFAEIGFKDSSGFYLVTVVLQERWYLWPEVIVKFQERNLSEWWRNKDLNRVDFGVALTRNNFLGRNQKLSGSFYLGFTERYGLSYSIPYLNKKLKDGLRMDVWYAKRNEVFAGVENNRMFYIKNDTNIIYKEFSSGLEYSRRNYFYLTHYLRMHYRNIAVSNDLKTLNYLSNNEGRLEFIQLSYFAKYDARFTKNYPLTGAYADLEIKQMGLGIFQRKAGLDVFQVTVNYRKYLQIKNRWYGAFGLYANVFNRLKMPFNFQEGLGFGNTYVRGFEQNVLLGRSSFLLKSNLKYQLISPKQFLIPFMKKWKKFSRVHFALYINYFIDAGYVNGDSMSNNLVNRPIIGNGIGLDWVTYYDIVFRTEYSINQFGDHGFYVSFVSPI